MAEEPELEVRTYKNQAQALGLAVNYLMKKPVFARLPFGHWSRVLVGQVNRGHYLFAWRGKKLVGFAGWAIMKKEDAENWLAGGSPSGEEVGHGGNCVVLNAWAADDAQVNAFLFGRVLDLMHREGKGVEALYAKREYADGRTRPLRRELL